MLFTRKRLSLGFRHPIVAAKKLVVACGLPSAQSRFRIGPVLFEPPPSIHRYSDRILRAMRMGVYEWQICSYMRKVLRPGDVFVDVGANIGYMTAVALDAMDGVGTAFCFEPVGAYYGRLLRLRELNPSLDIRPFNLAVCDKECEINIAVSSMNLGGNTAIPGIMDEPALRVERVRGIPLDAFFENIRHLTLLKIDVEGYELPALLGARGILERLRPIVICEIMPSAYSVMGWSLADLSHLLREVRYAVRDLSGKPLTVESIQNITTVLMLPSERL